MITFFQLTAAAGFLASVYAMTVKYKIAKNRNYTPACDISHHISCTKALGSSYSRTMGVPNPIGGMVYYTLLLVLTFFSQFTSLLLYVTLPPLLFSFYLAYISYIKQKNFCLVCSFVYIVNLTLGIMALYLK